MYCELVKIPFVPTEKEIALDLLDLTFVSVVPVSHWCVQVNLSKLDCQ